MSITYDLYVKQSGRWLLEKQFDRDERSDAVSEAKQLITLPGIVAARVIRERYDQRTQLASEHTIFDSSEEVATARPSAPVKREFGRRGKLPPDVHHQWNDESELDDLVYWDDISLFEDCAAVEPWQELSEESLERLRTWTKTAGVCVCGGSVAVLIFSAAWIMN